MDEILLSQCCDNALLDFKKGKRSDLILDLTEYEKSKGEYRECISSFVAFSMGSTANINLVYNNTLVNANVGDSLSFLFKNGTALLLNNEHKTSMKSESDRIIKSGSFIHNNRINGKLNLTRAVGDFMFKDQRLRQHDQAVTVYPEINTFQLDKSCEFLISACDGVWDCVEPQKLCEYISRRLS